MGKRGFTIVELLMVVGIIGVLLGIVVTASSSSVKMARRHRAEALCKMVQAGLATYHAQNGEWPVKNLPDKEANNQGVYSLNSAEVRQSVKALVDEAKKGNPVMDISGLFVARADYDPAMQKEVCRCGKRGCNGWKYKQGRVFGLDFWPAIHGVRDKSPNKMTTSQMFFGYPHPADGSFVRFGMNYYPASDTMTVWRWHWPDDDDE